MYLNAINNADRKRLKVAVINILEGVLKVFFLYYVYINSITINAEQAILIFMSACITAFLFNIFILSKNLLETFKIKKLLISLVYIKRVVNYGFPISLNSILYWLQNSGDKFLINTLKGPSTLGSYAIVYQYGYTTVMMIFDIINSYITPIVFQKYSENNNRNHKLYVIKVAAICLPLSIIFVSIMYLFKQDIILLVSNKEYLVYANYLPILSICAIFYCYSQLITLINHAEKRVVEVSKKKIQIIFLSIIFYIPMTYYYGINGLLFIIFVSNISLFLTAIYYAFFKKFRYSF
jgi:O-antigen/teichoic acid export membrane protein